ncbi:hypothetical protein [uncultured Tenacibaculum sp.]|uniref:hypothetical protein n=1 Tax=uncultured Tenacibaculum sp. TaxID=174713 RepID=UPI00262F72C3|nr:hypothetical protein [uncultured Tenacibaculum sp.]
MNKTILTSIFILTLSLAFSQNLKQQLWNFANPCNKAIIDGYEESFDKKHKNLKDYCKTCIDDSRNGYLFIEGEWPTCGCSCLNEIGAYRKTNGNYTLLKYESWPCSNSFGIYTNENLIDILPKHFSLKEFNSTAQMDTLNYFHLKMKIPRIGTDTKVKLKLFPLGQVGIGKIGISYNTKNSKKIYWSLSSIEWKIIKHLKNDYQIQLIMDKKINDLPQNIKNKILPQIGIDKAFKSEKELITKLSYIKRVYNAYMSLQYTEIIFSWNRILGRFEIKDKTGKPKQMSFLKFIKESQYLSPAC